LLADAASARGISEDVVLAEFKDRSPIGHLVTIDEVGWAVETLLAPEARSLAGGTLLLDSGQRTAFP
jgi:enoyl-[acyl-carrier-protein] reductase (NADH)